MLSEEDLKAINELCESIKTINETMKRLVDQLEMINRYGVDWYQRDC